MATRSGLEDALVAQLEKSGVPFLYEPLWVPWTPQPRKYRPDFVLWNGIVIEGKGYLDSEDKQKMRAVKKQHPDLDIRFVFSRAANRLNAKSQTTYAMWATKYGFPWAERTIPLSWLAEPPNPTSLAALKELDAHALAPFETALDD